MEALFLIKTGEIQLKGGNKAEFINRLKNAIKSRLSGVGSVLTTKEGRFYLSVSEGDAGKAAFVLSRTPGVNGWARACKTAKTMDAVQIAALDTIAPLVRSGASTFKIEARRSDKGFPLDSYAIARELGSAVLDRYPGLRVDVHNPAITLHVEIRDKAYIFTDGCPGVRGLPVGSAGWGLLLLSGGIDSPVAGYRMLGRGMALESLYFHAYPYTSNEAWEKVRDLAMNLGTFSGGMTLHTAQFAETQLKIKKDAPAHKTTLYLRACMMLAADMLARKRGLKALVTGESLSQVASQTAENLRFTGSFTDFPILRPLIGTDKEETIQMARAIGTYELSILPYEDCCVLFSPKHPLLKARFEEEREAFKAYGFEAQVAEAMERVETLTLPFSFTPPQAATILR